VNACVGPYEVDFLWRAERLVVETDGRASHATRAAFERDRARDARLTVAGYRVVRFTYRQVIHEPEVVGGLVRSLLRF
jgi:very-short-patch-repair endonuclease